MSDPRRFSRSVKRAAYRRSGGRCENPACRCPFPAGGGGVEYDHIINWEHSRDSSLENCRVLCSDCHLKKTSRYDIPVIAKCERIADRGMGIKRTGKKLPGGRDTNLTITFNGPKQRPPRYGKHHAAMARRQIGGET